MISRTQASGARDSVVSDTGGSPPVRGRDEQLQMITGFLERVRAGVGGVAIIEGAAGLGKTRLLSAARAAARRPRSGPGSVPRNPATAPSSWPCSWRRCSAAPSR